MLRRKSKIEIIKVDGYYVQLERMTPRISTRAHVVGWIVFAAISFFLLHDL